MNAALVKLRKAFDAERKARMKTKGIRRQTLCVVCHNPAELIDIVTSTRSALYECEYCGSLTRERI